MDSIGNIIEISSEGHFILDETLLDSIISDAQSCDRFALISIIGPKCSGKSFFMNCFFNYLETQNKSHWPNDCQISYGQYFCTDNSSKTKKSFIQMSRPLILEKYEQKIAVILMDSSNVFDTQTLIMANKLMKDVIGLYLFMSSTVVLLTESQTELEKMRENISGVGEIVEHIVELFPFKWQFQELFNIFTNWDSSRVFDSGDNYCYGFINGKNFFNRELGINTLSNYFGNIKSSLIPKPDLNCNQLNIDLIKLNKEFREEFLKLMESKLFYSEEIELKKYKNNELNVTSLIVLFRFYIKFLKKDFVNINAMLNEMDDELTTNSLLPPLPPVNYSEVIPESDELPLPPPELLETASPSSEILQPFPPPWPQQLPSTDEFPLPPDEPPPQALAELVTQLPDNMPPPPLDLLPEQTAHIFRGPLNENFSINEVSDVSSNLNLQSQIITSPLVSHTIFAQKINELPDISSQLKVPPPSRSVSQNEGSQKMNENGTDITSIFKRALENIRNAKSPNEDDEDVNDDETNDFSD